MSETRINERSLVPVSWLFLGFSFAVSTTVYCAFWVSAVNFRLGRIEEKLGIPSFHSTAEDFLSDTAYAESNRK